MEIRLVIKKKDARKVILPAKINLHDTEQMTVPVKADVPVILKDSLPAPATTTAQEDLVTYRQSRINLIWEFTQGIIAIVLVLTLCYTMVAGIEVKNEFWLLAGIVVQSYFQRTNHTRIGGVGYKTPGESR